MIKTATANASHGPADAAVKQQRTKPRPKKQPGKEPSGSGGSKAGPTGASPAGATASAGGSSSRDAQPKRRRTASQKKKDPDANGDAGPAKRHIAEDRSFFQDSRYERAPRLLPEIPGVRSLSMTDSQGDIKQIQQALHVFESKLSALRPGKSRFRSEDDIDMGASYLTDPMRRPRHATTPEELVESLPVCRRAVRITQRELGAMKREREDLERDFMRLRSQFIGQATELKRLEKQQNRVMQVLSRDVTTKAKQLESSRRRTSALQDIMTELETRGNAILRLTREKQRLETLLAQQGLEPPSIDDIYVGDTVETPFGKGVVLQMDSVKRVVIVKLTFGATGFLQEEDIEVLPSEVTYLEAEQQLKQRYFDVMEALVQPKGKFSMLGSGAASSRRRIQGDSDEDVDESESEDEDEEENDDANSDGQDGGESVSDGSLAVRGSSAADADDNSESARKKKKRKLNMMVPNGASKKPSKNTRVIDFPACKIPITPYDVGLLLSPLSTLPDRVAAVAPNPLQWMSSYLPTTMLEWEKERYESLQMKGEIERLRFQLQKTEAEKLDAQQHASDQLESINQLVAQLDKLRESSHLPSTHHHDTSSATSNANQHCPNCNGSTNAPRKTSFSSVKQTRGNAKATQKKDPPKRTRADSTVDSEPMDDSNENADEDDDQPNDEKETGEDDDVVESDDGVATSSKPTMRSLRPRRKAGAK